MTETAMTGEIEALVERLRSAAKHSDPLWESERDRLDLEAADALTRLTAELARVEAERDVARAGRAEAERENKRLDRELVAAQARQIANVVRREDANAYGDAEHARAEAAEARALTAEAALAKAVEAERAAEPALPPYVEVLPIDGILQWREYDASTWTADDSEGSNYGILRDISDPPKFCLEGDHIFDVFPSLELAQAAAQADYTKRCAVGEIA